LPRGPWFLSCLLRFRSICWRKKGLALDVNLMGVVFLFRVLDGCAACCAGVCFLACFSCLSFSFCNISCHDMEETLLLSSIANLVFIFLDLLFSRFLQSFFLSPLLQNSCTLSFCSFPSFHLLSHKIPEAKAQISPKTTTLTPRKPRRPKKREDKRNSKSTHLQLNPLHNPIDQFLRVRQ
jgi:hypothetical protein